MAPSSGIGVHQLFVSISDGSVVTFKDQRLRIESSHISGPIYTQFGVYNRGVYGPIGPIKGPSNRFFFIQSIENFRPDTIDVLLPAIESNGAIIQAEPVKFKLTKNPSLVGLCQ